MPCAYRGLMIQTCNSLLYPPPPNTHKYVVDKLLLVGLFNNMNANREGERGGGALLCNCLPV